jgi:pimeloyl-ACP methyl ester carboxylesterase
VLTGALDESTPPAQSRALHAAIAGSRLVILDDDAHLSNVEQPDIFNAHVGAFLGVGSD